MTMYLHSPATLVQPRSPPDNDRQRRRAVADAKLHQRLVSQRLAINEMHDMLLPAGHTANLRVAKKDLARLHEP